MRLWSLTEVNLWGGGGKHIVAFLVVLQRYIIETKHTSAN